VLALKHRKGKNAIHAEGRIWLRRSEKGGRGDEGIYFVYLFLPQSLSADIFFFPLRSLLLS
jgi:hypothetical protein